jgi:AcrR family transcriptional regulator
VSAARDAGVASGPAAPEAMFPKLRPGPGLKADRVASHQRARIRRAGVEAVADRGCAAVTMRDLAGLAGVSTKALYENYSSKEACLLHAQELITRRWLRRLADSREEGRGDERRVGLALRALVDEWSRDPQAARFALVEAYASGPLVLEEASRGDRRVEALVATTFGRLSGEGARMTPLLGEAVAAGAVAAARSRLLYYKKGEQLSCLGAPLVSWALSYPSPEVSRLRELDRAAESRFSDAPDTTVLAPPSGDFELLLAAVGKLVASDGLDGLTMADVLAAAGLPRPAFRANFSDLEDCVSQAFEAQAASAIGRMESVASRSATPSQGVIRAIDVLCARIARDPVFAALCFGEISTLGSRGMECRERFMVGVQRIVSNAGIATGSLSERVACQASVGAVWRILEGDVAAGRAHRAPGTAASLAYLLLAPSIGAAMALEAIDDEQVRAVRI